MEVLNSEFTFDSIMDGVTTPIDKQHALLWVWHADKIAPHIGLSVNGSYFSLKANGTDVNLPIDSIIELIHKKKIPTLCVELEINLNVSDVESEFLKYTKTIPHEITCLEPIKRVVDMVEASQLGELLEMLKGKNQLKQVFGFYLPDGFDHIRAYTLKDVHQRLADLSRKQ